MGVSRGKGCAVLFDAGKGDALDELFLERDEHDEHRDHHQRGHRHGGAVVRQVLRGEKRQRQRQRHALGVIEHDERRQVIVPHAEEHEDGQRTDGGLHIGQDDAPIDHEVGGAVDLRRLTQAVGDVLDELAAHKNAEGDHDAGDDQRA